MAILQVAHTTEIPGPVQFLERYFRKKGSDIFKIYHPLDESVDRFSRFAHGDQVLAEKRAPKGIIGYFSDFLATVRWMSRVKEPIEKAIGMNCFDVLPLILFKKRFNISEVIFFNTDFSRKRFGNPLLNCAYVSLDRFCAKRADKLCCNTKRTIGKRIEEGVDEKRIVHTPNGVFLDEIGKVDLSKKKFEKKILFIGHVSKAHGLQDIIKLLSDLDLKLEIIGSGDYESELRALAESLGIAEKVAFLGRKDRKDVIEYLKGFGGFGIAPYSLDGGDWVYYCDPVKVKEYLACGVPVIISDVPEVSSSMSDAGTGLVYSDGISLSRHLVTVSRMDNDEYDAILSKVNGFAGDAVDLGRAYRNI